MKKSSLQKAIFFGLAVFISPIINASCDFMDEAPEPDWITTPKKSTEFFFGMSTSLVEDENVSLAIQTSKQKAIEDLASSIKVNIKSQLTIAEALNSSGQSTQDIESLSSLTVDNTLEEVKVDGIWLDQDNCQLWTLVKVSKNSVTKQKELTLSLKLLASFHDSLTQSNNPNIDYAERINEVRTAKALFEKIKFELLTSTTETVEKNKLSAIELIFSENTPKYQKANNLLNQLKSVNNQFINLSDKPTQTKLVLEAKSLNQKIQETSPVSSQLGVAEQSLAYIADMEEHLNNSCAAKTKWQVIIKNSQNNALLALAKQKSKALSCSKKELEKATIRAMFEGKNVRLWCSKHIENKVVYWEKACDTLRETVTQYGALVSNSQQIPELALADFDKIPTLDNHIDISLYAKGSFDRRNNPKNPNGVDYRFNGKIKQQVNTNNQIIIKDNFNGLTGWNPVSEDFALDLLALTLTKRFKSKLNHALSN